MMQAETHPFQNLDSKLVVVHLFHNLSLKKKNY